MKFTELNLNKSAANESKNHSADKRFAGNCGSGIPARKLISRTKTTMFTALVAIGAISGTSLLILNGCSRKESPKAEAATAPQPATTGSPAISPAPLPVSSETQAPKATKKPKKSSHVTYVNKSYGLSLQYPRKYTLKTGDDAQLDINGSPLPMNFPKSGGITVAAIEMPRGIYPGTDLSQAFLIVNVNRNLTASECEIGTSQGNSSDVKPVSENAQAPEAKIGRIGSDKVKIGQREYSEEEKSLDAQPVASESNSGSTAAQKLESTNRSEAKYYHVFENGACYEFAMALATDVNSANETKPVDREAVFGNFQKILASLKIKPATMPEEVAKQDVGQQNAATEKPSSESAPQQFEPTPVYPE